MTRAPDNPDRIWPYTIGVDLGGTNLRIAAYTCDDGLLETISLPTRLAAGRDAVVNDLCENVKKLIKTHSRSRQLVGIGVGTPGPLELPVGKLHKPPNLPGWDGFALRAELENKLEHQVAVESDANLAALAECMLGSGRAMGTDSLCMLTLGTGIGNGIILHGTIWHGTTGMAGEAGHLTIWPDGPECGCGNKGCLEMYASATALVRLARKAASAATTGLGALIRRNPNITAHDIALLARAGDEQALSVFDCAAEALGIGIANLVNTLNLPLYVIGGGLANAWDIFAPKMLAFIRDRSYVYRLTEPGNTVLDRATNHATIIQPAALGSDAGLLGACILAYNSSESRIKGMPEVNLTAS